MQKRLKQAYWAGNVLTVLFLVIMVLVTRLNDLDTHRGSLRAILHTASAWTAEASRNLQELADEIAQAAAPLKVTFMMPNGIILAQSGDGAMGGRALLERPEVHAALENGVREHFSFADSLVYPTINAAALLNGKLVLHLQKPVQEIPHLLLFYLPLIGLICLAMVAISRWLIEPVTGRIVKQLEQIQRLLEGTVQSEEIDEKDYYPELRPGMQHIICLIDRMRYDLEQISKSQDMQRDFVDNSSHELKSPLTSVMGFAEMLHDDPDMPLPKRQEALGYILAECDRMRRVIDDILMLERQERTDAAEMALVDLRQAALQVAASLKPQAARTGATIQVAGEGSVMAREADVLALLRNLVSNALRYGKPDGWVKVELAGNRLVVRDNGIGIAPEHLSRIFEKFYRVDSARDRRAGGTGLGLAIVAGITNRYGAKIHVDSVLGDRSVFTLVFPGIQPKEEEEA